MLVSKISGLEIQNMSCSPLASCTCMMISLMTVLTTSIQQQQELGYRWVKSDS